MQPTANAGLTTEELASLLIADAKRRPLGMFRIDEDDLWEIAEDWADS
jgi:hypothetical protein